MALETVKRRSIGLFKKCQVSSKDHVLRLNNWVRRPNSSLCRNAEQVEQGGMRGHENAYLCRDGCPEPKQKRARRCGHTRAVSRCTVVSVRCAA